MKKQYSEYLTFNFYCMWFISPTKFLKLFVIDFAQHVDPQEK